MLTKQEVIAIITLIRRAPLQNMQEAEGAAVLVTKLAALHEMPQTEEKKAKSKRNGS